MKKRSILHSLTALVLMVTLAGSLLVWAQVSTWSSGAPMTDDRDGAASAAISGKLYIAGGSPGNPTTIIYDPSTNTWSFSGASMATTRCAMASGDLNGLFVAAEGWYGCNSSSPSTALEMYDTGTNAWSSGPPSLLARGSVAAAVVGGRLLIAGGATSGYFVTFNQLEIYDPSTSSWSLGATMPLGLPEEAGAEMGGKFYVVGGYDPSASAFRDDLQIYDPASNTWSTGPSMPTARGLAFAVAIDGKLYVVGGHTSTAALDVVEIFDPVTNSWSTGPTAPTARFYGAGGVIDNSICLTAGQDNSALRRELDILSVEVVPTPTPTPIPTPTPPPTPSPSPTGTPQIGPPTNKDQCKNGGWQIFNTPRTFMNQGDCIQFVNTGR